MFTIRAARPAEIDLVLEIEDLAGRTYAQAGLPGDLPGMTRAMVAQAQADGLLRVVDHGSHAVGFALSWVRPDAVHLRELGVHPDFMRRGLGRRLVESIVADARAWGHSRVTLTTFAEVPWNAPLYRRWGFVDIEPADVGTWMVEIRAAESALGLDVWPRLAMVRSTGFSA